LHYFKSTSGNKYGKLAFIHIPGNAELSVVFNSLFRTVLIYKKNIMLVYKKNIMLVISRVDTGGPW
jgi:hypothetical protein